MTLESIVGRSSGFNSLAIDDETGLHECVVVAISRKYEKPKSCKSEKVNEANAEPYSHAEMKRKLVAKFLDVVDHYVNLNYERGNTVSFAEAFLDYERSLGEEERRRFEQNRPLIDCVCDEVCGKGSCCAYRTRSSVLLRENSKVHESLKDDDSAPVWVCKNLFPEEIYAMLSLEEGKYVSEE